MAARRNQAPQKPNAPLILAGASVLAGYGIYAGYPGLAALWVAVIFAAWTYPPAVLTGKKDSRGYATAAHPGETAIMNKYRFWEDLKFKMVIPSGDWLPGFKPVLSWLLAVWAGSAAFLVPVTDEYTGAYGPWINAAAAFILVTQLTASRRRNQVAGDENPGARIDSLIRLFKKNKPLVIGLTVGGAVTGTLIGAAVTVVVPWALDLGGLAPIPGSALWALCISIGPLAFLAKPWITESLEHWLVVVAAREEWNNRWVMLKQDPAPRLVDRRTVGPATIDTFDAPPETGGAGAYFLMGPKIIPTMGTGTKFAILSTENLDSQRQPVAGSRNPLRFEISNWPSDQIPDISDASIPEDVVTELVRCALVWAADDAGYGRPLLDRVHRLTTHDTAETSDNEDGKTAQPMATPAAWAVTWHLPDGPPPSHIRSGLKGGVSGILGVEALVDHRAFGGAGCMYLGGLDDPATQWDKKSGITAKQMEELANEDVWDQRWIEVMKMGSNPPVVQAPTASSAKLATGGVTVNTISFVTRQGMTPHDFFTFEPKMATVMAAAPFVTLTGYRGDGGRAGERHPQAFSIFWSDKPVPSRPDALAPVPRSDAPKWVLAGRVNEAFKAARLADRPEIINAVCLTRPESRGHIWKIDLRLFAGVTLADVRGALQKIKGAWGSEWVRVTAAKDGCTIVAGANPSKVKLVDAKHERYLADLDWEQAFLDAKISGIGGQLPKLTKVDHMPLNKQVKILEFDLTGTGLDFARMKESRATLEATSGNSFVEVRRVKNSATKILILASEVSPMPEHAPYDYQAIDKSKALPFATGIEGEPVEFDLKSMIHLMVVGGSGSGKSVILQGLVTGAFARGCDLYIADPTKGAADFAFAEAYSMAFCKDLLDTGAMMKGVYEEVKRRVALNTKYGVGNFRDLPEEVRPRPIVVVLDEFTSLIAPDAVAKPSDDPEIEAERDTAMAINGAKAEVGAFTAKISREARSAGVTLILATQKLTAKDLDTIPGGSTLKDLDLDALLPVPASEKFPSGWARNRELKMGDLLYSVDGKETAIAGFSPIIDQDSTWEVEFDDGQIVTAGAGHLWNVSDNKSRQWWDTQALTSAVNAQWLPRAAIAAHLSQSVPVGTWASHDTVAATGGLYIGLVLELAERFGTPTMNHAAGLMIDAGEFFTMLAAHAGRMSTTIQADTLGTPLERVTTTADMAIALDAGWAVSLPGAIEGSSTDNSIDARALGEDSITGSTVLPSWILRAPTAQRCEALRGLTRDADYSTAGNTVIRSDSEELIQQAAELAGSLGFWYRVSDDALAVKVAADETLNPTRLRRHIIDIRLVDPVQTRCIAVEDPSHQFLVEGFIPTHNTNLSRLIAGKSTQGERMSALKDPMNAPVMGDSIPPGRAIFEPVTSGPVLIQCWYDKREQEALGEYVGGKRDPLLESEKLDLSKYRRREPGERQRSNVIELEEIVLDMDDLDLGEIELTLDDLEMDLGETEPAAGGLKGGMEEPISKPVGIEELEWDIDPIAMPELMPSEELVFEMIEPESAASELGEPEPAGLEIFDLESEPEDEPIEPTAIFEEVSSGSIDRSTVLMLDLDGCLFPFTQSDGMVSLSTGANGTAFYDPAVLDAINRIPVRQYLLTSRGPGAVGQFAKLLPRIEGALDGSTEEHGWWKIDAAADFIRDNPEVQRVIWIDDELAGDDPLLGIPMMDIARDALTGAQTLLLTPDPYSGVGNEHFQEINDFLGNPEWLIGELDTEEDELPEPATKTEPPTDLGDSGIDSPAVPRPPASEPDWENFVIEDATLPAPVAEAPEANPFEEPSPRPASTASAEIEDDPFADSAPVKTAPHEPATTADDDDPFADVTVPVRRRPVIDDDGLFG